MVPNNKVYYTVFLLLNKQIKEEENRRKKMKKLKVCFSYPYTNNHLLY